MGDIFADNAPLYAEKGFRVFPTGGHTGKIPHVLGWPKAGKKTLPIHIEKFPDANIGVIDGELITRIDIDDPELIDGAIRRFGDSPVKVRTPSDGFHLWFAASGERRMHKLEGQDIDILGEGGFGNAPPSINPRGGAYTFLVGGLDDVFHLPVIRRGSLPPSVYRKITPRPGNASAGGKSVQKGSRTISMFNELRKIALQCETPGAKHGIPAGRPRHPIFPHE